MFTILQVFCGGAGATPRNDGDRCQRLSPVRSQWIYRFEKKSELVQQNRFGRSKKLVRQQALRFTERSLTVDTN